MPDDLLERELQEHLEHAAMNGICLSYVHVNINPC